MSFRPAQFAFYLWVLGILGLMQFIYSKSVEHFGRGKLAQVEISSLQSKVLSQEFAAAVALLQMQDLRGQMLAQAEITGNSRWAQSLRAPASADSLLVGRVQSDLKMTEAKERFQKRDFRAAISGFTEVIERFPWSFHVPEAYFLRMESFFVMGELESALAEIEQIISRYPESIYAGFSLVRMASIFREQGGKESQANRLLQIARTEHSQYQAVLKAAKEEELTLSQSQTKTR